MKDKIIKFSKDMSIDLIGFTRCRRFDELYEFYEYRKERGLFNEFEEQDIEKKINPFMLMEDGKTIISLAFPYYYGDDGKPGGFSVYTRGIDYHRVVNEYLDKICEYIKSLGGKAEKFTDSNPLPERYIATQCGIGFIGRNNALITKKYGSYVFLGEIITDMELQPDQPNKESCLECGYCMEKCPTNVIIESGKDFNSSTCLSYITQKKELTQIEMGYVNGNIFGCDACQRCCPHNKNIQRSEIELFKPKDYMVNPDYLSLIKMNNAEFKERYKNHSCSWRGKNLIIRNAMISYCKANDNEAKRELKKYINSPYIMGYYERLMEEEK